MKSKENTVAQINKKEFNILPRNIFPGMPPKRLNQHYHGRRAAHKSHSQHTCVWSEREVTAESRQVPPER